MPNATVTTKGQVTIPKAVRQVLGVQAGDRLAFRIGGDGKITVEAENTDVRALRGSLRPAVRGVTIEAMSTAIRRRGARKR